MIDHPCLEVCNSIDSKEPSIDPPITGLLFDRDGMAALHTCFDLRLTLDAVMLCCAVLIDTYPTRRSRQAVKFVCCSSSLDMVELD